MIKFTFSNSLSFWDGNLSSYQSGWSRVWTLSLFYLLFKSSTSWSSFIKGEFGPHVKGIVEIMVKKSNYHLLTIKAFGTIGDLSIKKYPKAI